MTLGPPSVSEPGTSTDTCPPPPAWKPPGICVNPFCATLNFDAAMNANRLELESTQLVRPTLCDGAPWIMTAGVDADAASSVLLVSVCTSVVPTMLPVRPCTAPTAASCVRKSVASTALYTCRTTAPRECDCADVPPKPRPAGSIVRVVPA